MTQESWAIPVLDELLRNFSEMDADLSKGDDSSFLDHQAYAQRQYGQVRSLLSNLETAVGGRRINAFEYVLSAHPEYITYPPEAYRLWRSAVDAAKSEIRQVIGGLQAPIQSRTVPNQDSVGDPHKVFVVHGRNLKARDSMFALLRSIGLQPIEWSEAVSLTGKPSPFVLEILDAALSHARAIVVLLTPDDEARLLDRYLQPDDPAYEKTLTPQARANVLFEAGLAFGRSPDRVVIVQLGALRPFTDIGGMHLVQMADTSQKRQELAQRLKLATCDVSLDGTSWHSAGDFNLRFLGIAPRRGRAGSQAAQTADRPTPKRASLRNPNSTDSGEWRGSIYPELPAPNEMMSLTLAPPESAVSQFPITVNCTIMFGGEVAFSQSISLSSRTGHTVNFTARRMGSYDVTWTRQDDDSVLAVGSFFVQIV